MAKQKPAEGGEEQAPAAPNSGDNAPAAEGNKDREHEEGDDKANKEKRAKVKEDKDVKKPPPPPPVVTAVLKVDMHCDGCAERIRGSVHRYPGVEGVAMEADKGSMTVVGRFDAKKLRDRVADKTRKTVDLVSGGGKNQKKGANNEDGKQVGKGDEQEGKDKTDRQEEEGKGKGKKGGRGKDNKKPVVPVVATAVLKVGSTGLHCDGCMNRIRSKLFKIKGTHLHL